MSPEPESCWTAVANIVRERPYGPGGAEIRRGTKHFAPGAKVYIIDWYAGTCERIAVVGLHRSSKRMITLIIAVKLVENLRAKVCYVPAVLAQIKAYYAPDGLSPLSKEAAEIICQTVPFWQAQPWRHQVQVSQPEPSSATLQLLRAAAANKPKTVLTMPERIIKATPTSFLTKLWLSVKFLLED
jgi:hypothetical protein